MRVLVVSDAWRPQVNGVVRTLERLVAEAPRQGAEVEVLGPSRFRTMACPTYPEIRLALTRPARVVDEIERFAPDAIHIATEGPLGMIARRYCLRHGFRFTTSYHTRFPEYLAARMPVPTDWSYAFLRRFHNSGSACFVATPSLEEELAQRGFTGLRRWSRGVDTDVFHPRSLRRFGDDGPVFLYVGRVAVEKNLDAFLSLDLPGRKVVVGDGPAREALQARYPDVLFAGVLTGEALAEAYASADVFVFPSLTDTFGIVLLEALACGVPVAAFPVTGPKDIVENGVTGVLSDDLGSAARQALLLSREACRKAAEGYSWAASTAQFLANVIPMHKGSLMAA